MNIEAAMVFLVMLCTFTWMLWEGDKRQDKLIKELLKARDDVKRYQMLYELTKEDI